MKRLHITVLWSKNCRTWRAVYDDGILFDAKRGHTAQEVVEAVARLKQRNMTVGIQLLPGLKGETWQTIIETAITVAAFTT